MVGKRRGPLHRRATLAGVGLRPTPPPRSLCRRATDTLPPSPPMPRGSPSDDDASERRVPRRAPSEDAAMGIAPHSLDSARARLDALAALHAGAIDACRHAADTCARRMLRALGDHDSERMRLAMDGVEIFGATAGVVARRSPYAVSALQLCETVALGCATAFERDEADDPVVQACRDCARACRALRTSVAPVRMHGTAA